MRMLFADILPDALLTRSTKARFNSVVFNEHSREFVETWTGGGIDPDLVDAERLSQAWDAPQVHAMTFALLQACWLSERARTQGTPMVSPGA